MRQSPSLYGVLLKKALHLEQVWEKAEQVPPSLLLPFFVGTELFSQIHNNSPQLIVGRRGTGKTHFLGAFSQYVWTECPSEIPIIISITDLGQTPPLPYTESSDFIAKRMAREKFEQFLRLLLNRLIVLASQHCEIRLKPGMQKREWETLQQKVDNQLLRLMEAIELGREYHIAKKRHHSITRKQELETGKGAEIELGLMRLQPHLDARLSRGKRSKSTDDDEMETTIDSIIGVDLHDVREIISNLIELLKINTIYILIDEWMEIDKNTPSSVQAYFAQLLKITFLNHPHNSVKIGSIWHETTLYSRGDIARSQGLQLGHDIQMGPDLDTAFLSAEEDIWRFCKELLFRRLSHVSPELRSLRTDGEIDNIFITELFDNKSNFKAFIAASHGIPRDIMKIFHKCSLRIKSDFSKDCIDYTLISNVAKDIYKTETFDLID